MGVLLKLPPEGDLRLPRFLRLKAAELARVAEEARHPAVAARLRATAAHYMERARRLEVDGAGRATGSGNGDGEPGRIGIG